MESGGQAPSGCWAAGLPGGAARLRGGCAEGRRGEQLRLPRHEQRHQLARLPEVREVVHLDRRGATRHAIRFRFMRAQGLRKERQRRGETRDAASLKERRPEVLCEARRDADGGGAVGQLQLRTRTGGAGGGSARAPRVAHTTRRHPRVERACGRTGARLGKPQAKGTLSGLAGGAGPKPGRVEGSAASRQTKSVSPGINVRMHNSVCMRHERLGRAATNGFRSEGRPAGLSREFSVVRRALGSSVGGTYSLWNPAGTCAARGAKRAIKRSGGCAGGQVELACRRSPGSVLQRGEKTLCEAGRHTWRMNLSVTRFELSACAEMPEGDAFSLSLLAPCWSPHIHRTNSVLAILAPALVRALQLPLPPPQPRARWPSRGPPCKQRKERPCESRLSIPQLPLRSHPCYRSQKRVGSLFYSFPVPSVVSVGMQIPFA